MDYLSHLNDKQKEAVLHTGSPLLILAGAGSGKTRVITTKIVYLLEEKGIDPQSILAVTFTNKAADEMRNRILDSSFLAEKVMIRTFHSFGAWLLRRNSHVAGLSEKFVIYDSDDKLSLLKSVLNKEYSPAEVKNFAYAISRAKDSCLSPSDDLSILGFNKNFPDVYKQYQDKLDSIGNVDFDDLIMKPVVMLRSEPAVKQRIQQRFRVILVDEFQDSNHVQFELLKEMYDGSNYICVVGDEDQSIYGFRGALVDNIINFPDVFKDTQVVMLEQNYRSTPQILEAAAAVVDNNTNRMGKKLWTELSPGEKVKLAFLTDQDAEAQFAAMVLDSDMNLAGTAILYRNNYQSRTFETYFQRIGVPYRVVGSLRFFEREEVKDVMAWLSLVVNPRDEVAFSRIINKPVRGIGAKTIEKILGKHAVSAIAACEETLESLPKKTASAIKDFIDQYYQFCVFINSLPLADTIVQITKNTGLMDHYKERDRIEHTTRIQNLYELANAAIRYPAGIDALGEFLENNKLDSGSEAASGSTEKVTLITIHNTKGLEFDRVILTGLEDGLFPYIADTSLGANYDDEIEEERRLFYVGITRAKKELYLTSCRTRRAFGSNKEQLPSRFLQELPKDKIEILGGSQEQDEQFNIGDRVYHDEYGTGVVVNNGYQNNTQFIDVQFQDGQTARILPKYSPIERIG